ncbi:MAG TPA: type II secretion system protein [Lacunisphaera sp.]|jgi:prepilin-type N-terminal cleavage/methylation domain-containing protein
MKSSLSRRADAAGLNRRGFTLVEVLASLLLMAIIVPVAMQGMSIASRAGIVSQRKAAAMRVAERVMDEMIATNQLTQNSTSGSQTDGDTTYAWTMTAEPWSADTMTQLTVRVTFTVQGHDYDVAASTLFDPATTGANATAS